MTGRGRWGYEYRWSRPQPVVKNWSRRGVRSSAAPSFIADAGAVAKWRKALVLLVLVLAERWNLVARIRGMDLIEQVEGVGFVLSQPLDHLDFL